MRVSPEKRLIAVNRLFFCFDRRSDELSKKTDPGA